MDAIPDRAPTECPSCGELFDPRDDGVELSVSAEGESQVTCPHCAARFHYEAESEFTEPGGEEF
jgi:uncharacterized Zn-finger protein